MIKLCKKDKVIILKSAIKTLLINQSYQAFSLSFNLYVNDSKKDKPIESTKKISKYFDKPFV